MPIRPSYAVAPALQVAAAVAGRQQEQSQQAQQQALRQQQLAEQSRQFNIQAALGQQNRIQDRLYDMVRMQQGAAIDAEMMRRRAQQQQALSQQQFDQQRQLYAERDERAQQAQFEAEGMGQSRSLSAILNGYNERGDQVFDVANLNEQGQSLHKQINQEFDELNKQYRDGAVRPRDYTYAVNELASRAQSLERFQNPPQITMQERVQQETFKMGRTVWTVGKDGTLSMNKEEYPDPSQYPEGQRPGEVWFDPGKGLLSRDRYGDVRVETDITDVRMKLADKAQEMVTIEEVQYQDDGTGQAIPIPVAKTVPLFQAQGYQSVSEYVEDSMQWAVPKEWTQQQPQQGQPMQPQVQQPQPAQSAQEPSVYASPVFTSTAPLTPGTAEAEEARQVLHQVSQQPLSLGSMEQAFKVINRFDGQYRDSQYTQFFNNIAEQVYEPEIRQQFLDQVAMRYGQSNEPTPQYVKDVIAVMAEVEQRQQEMLSELEDDQVKYTELVK